MYVSIPSFAHPTRVQSLDLLKRNRHPFTPPSSIGHLLDSKLTRSYGWGVVTPPSPKCSRLAPEGSPLFHRIQVDASASPAGCSRYKRFVVVADNAAKRKRDQGAEDDTRYRNSNPVKGAHPYTCPAPPLIAAGDKPVLRGYATRNRSRQAADERQVCPRRRPSAGRR